MVTWVGQWDPLSMCTVHAQSGPSVNPTFPAGVEAITIRVYKGAEQGRADVLKGPLLKGTEPVSSCGHLALNPCLCPVSCVAGYRNQKNELEGHRAAGGASLRRGCASSLTGWRSALQSPLLPSALHTGFPECQSSPRNFHVSTESVGASHIAPRSLHLWTESGPHSCLEEQL